MEVITRFIFYLFAFILPYGSVNPFNLTSVQGVSEGTISQQGIGPYLFAICAIMAVFDRRILMNYKTTKKFILPLGILFFALLISSMLSSSRGLDFPTVFFLKLIAAEVGFVILTLYFIQFPVVLYKSLTIYAYSCALIVMAYYLGLLDGLYFMSNGRLWLFGENPNSYSFMMGLGSIILIHNNLYSHPPRYVAVLNILLVTAIFLYMILSGSRGSILICALAIFVLCYKLLIKKSYLIIPLLLIIGYVLYEFIAAHQSDISLLERFSELHDGDSGRMKLLREACTLFTEKPVLGWGRNGYIYERLSRFQEERDSHNIILSVAVMSGVIGATALISFFYKLFKSCAQTFKANVLPLVLFFYVFFMAMKTGDVITFAMMWYCFSLMLAMASLSKTELSLSS